MTSFTDTLLLEARDAGIRAERSAALDLLSNLERYCAPSWKVNELVKGYDHYTQTSENTQKTYEYLRETFSETQGESHQLLSNVIANHIPKRDYDFSKSMFSSKDPENDVKTGLYHLKHFGFYKTRLVVPNDIVESLKAKIYEHLNAEHGNPVEDMLAGADSAPLQLKTDARWLSTCEEIYKISGDPILLAMVQAYMGVPPIFNTPVCFLNSFKAVKNQRELSQTAQLFHHDMHRLKFVKMFVYLTDVTTDTGPHVMIPGTHKERPGPLWKDGRHSDEVVDQAGILKNETEIVGKAGTLFLVDTSALHKGAHPKLGPRLIAQVQYSNSLFGKPMAASDHKIEMVQDTSNQNIIQAAEHVRKYAEFSGTRFMQNYI